MTKREGAIISAYTGKLFCDINDLDMYLNEILEGHTATLIRTLSQEKFEELVRLKSLPHLEAIVNNLED